MPNSDKYITELERLALKSGRQFEQLLRVFKKESAKAFKALKYTQDGFKVGNVNQQVLDSLAQKLDQIGTLYVEDVFGSDKYYRDGGPLNTDLGEGLNVMSDIALETIGVTGVKSQVDMLRHARVAIDDSKTMVGRMKNEFYDYFKNEIQTGKDPGDLRDWIRNYDNPASKRYAELIARSTYSSGYQQMSNDTAAEIGLKKMRLGGPAPMQGDKGHTICQRFYGTIFTQEDIEDFIAANAGACARDGINSFSDFLIYVGGYNCRHYIIWLTDKAAGRFNEREAVAEYNRQVKVMERQ